MVRVPKDVHQVEEEIAKLERSQDDLLDRLTSES